MKQFVCNLFALAAVAFTLSFCTGMSISLMYQEYRELKPFIAAQQSLQEDEVLSASDPNMSNPDFS